MKSGNLNFLEPSGPLQACNGTALSLHDSLYTMRTGKFGPEQKIFDACLNKFCSYMQDEKENKGRYL